MRSLAPRFAILLAILCFLVHGILAVTLAAQPRCFPQNCHYTAPVIIPADNSNNGLTYQNFSVATEDNNLISAASGKPCSSGIPQPACKITLTGTKGPSYHQVPQTIQTSLVFPELDPGHRIGDFVMNTTSYTVKGGFEGEWEGLSSLW
ncbi:hypothetical protein DL98DRAFT_570202 [Cadophora sp. DSE1049]|nr:hypothetical protein DL98DRAFT_570202 [Cadophora sp. DSE1049]